MISELWIVEDVEGSGRGLIQVLFRKLSGETVENHEETQHSRSSGRHTNPGLPEYEDW
jgi:hypothetical protein